MNREIDSTNGFFLGSILNCYREAIIIAIGVPVLILSFIIRTEFFCFLFLCSFGASNRVWEKNVFLWAYFASKCTFDCLWIFNAALNSPSPNRGHATPSDSFLSLSLSHSLSPAHTLICSFLVLRFSLSLCLSLSHSLTPTVPRPFRGSLSWSMYQPVRACVHLSTSVPVFFGLLQLFTKGAFPGLFPPHCNRRRRRCRRRRRRRRLNVQVGVGFCSSHQHSGFEMIERVVESWTCFCDKEWKHPCSETKCKKIFVLKVAMSWKNAAHRCFKKAFDELDWMCF